MSDGWDEGWTESLDDGHEFADRVLSDRPTSGGGFHRDEHDKHFDADAAEINMSPGAQGRARRLDKGVIEAKFPGTCEVCHSAIQVNDPITSNAGGWRHAGCGVPQQSTSGIQPF